MANTTRSTGHGAHAPTERRNDERRGSDSGGDGDHQGHDRHAEAFRRLFWINTALAVPVLLFSDQIQRWLGFDLSLPGSGWIAPVIGTVIYFYGGRPFLTGGLQEARDRRPGMMLLIALAITVAFMASVLSLTDLLDLAFWWELATLIVVMLLGHWQEMRAIGQARGALSALAELIPDDAERITHDGNTESVPVAELRVGDLVLVRTGSRVPADGTIAEGVAEFDESMITGESNPAERSEGDEVVAGTVATDNTVRVEITAVGEDTALGGIQRLVSEAQESKSHAQALADRAAGILFYVALGAAAITAIVWLAIDRPEDALTRTITVLIIACPHALGLAIPLVISLATAKGAQSGILVRDRLALERTRAVDIVFFDKTGTLTAGEHRVTDLAASGVSEDRLLSLAAAAERDSEHPLARAIVAFAEERGVERLDASDFDSMTGRGVTAKVAGSTISVGGPSLLDRSGIESPGELAASIGEWEKRGAAVLHVIDDGSVIGVLALEDRIRDESRQAVDGLHDLGIDVAMITGDSDAVAGHVAKQLGIDDVYAQILPEDKNAKIIELQDQGRTVAMVGDGVNDAPALAQADVGLAIGAGTDVAIESAGVILASSDPRNVVGVVALSNATYRKMVQNLAWAAGYNVAAIPLAAGVLAPVGFVLPPAIGAALMSASTVIVALNAQLLRRLDLSPEQDRAA